MMMVRNAVGFVDHDVHSAVCADELFLHCVQQSTIRRIPYIANRAPDRTSTASGMAVYICTIIVADRGRYVQV